MTGRLLGLLLASAVFFPTDSWAQFEIVATKSELGYQLQLHEGDTVMVVSFDTLEQYLSRRLAPGDSLNAADYDLLEALHEFIRSEPGSTGSDSASANIEATTRIQIKSREHRNRPACAVPAAGDAAPGPRTGRSTITGTARRGGPSRLHSALL